MRYRKFFAKVSYKGFGTCIQYSLGIEVARSWTCINLSQTKYVLDLLEDIGLMGGRHVEVPIDSNQKLLRMRGLFEDPSMYHRLVGKYLIITMLDI